MTILLSAVTLIYWILYGNQSGLGYTFLGFFLGILIAFDKLIPIAANTLYLCLLLIIGLTYNHHNNNYLSEYVSQFDIILNYSVTFILIVGAMINFISSLKDKEANLQLQKENLKIKNDELIVADIQNKNKTELLKMIAHDLRGPISSYKNLSQKFNFLIQNNEIDNIQNIAGHMEKSSERLFSNIENLLNWVLTQQDNISVDKKYISTHDIIQEIISELYYIAVPNNINIVNEIPINSMIFSDRNMLRIILRNLMDNAIKFSPKDSKVVISTESNVPYLSIVIKDSGPGIKSDILTHIKTQENLIKTSIKGYGLGLTICYFFAEIIDAQLSFNNDESGGAIVRIKLRNVF